MAEIWSKLLELLKGSTKLQLVLALGSGLALFFPKAVPSLHLDKLVDAHGMWVGAVFVLAGLGVVVSATDVARKWIRVRYNAASKDWEKRARLRNLSNDEKRLLQLFVLAGRRAVRVPVNIEIDVVNRLLDAEIVHWTHPLTSSEKCTIEEWAFDEIIADPTLVGLRSDRAAE